MYGTVPVIPRCAYAEGQMSEEEVDVIDGVLSYRTSCDDEWVQVTPQELTSRYLSYKQAYEESHAGWIAADGKLRKIKAILEQD